MLREVWFRHRLSTRLTIQRVSIGSQPIKRCFTEVNAIERSRQFNNKPEIEPIRVPGYGRSLDHACHHPDIDVEALLEDDSFFKLQAFAHGFSSWMQPIRNLVRELHMLRIMDILTDKPQWNVKVFDDEIMARWRLEAKSLPGKLISERAWEWIANELRWKATLYSRQGYVTTLETESTIVKGDNVIPETLREELEELVRPLRDVDENLKDWQPGSDERVLELSASELVPSGWPGDGEPIEIPDRPEEGVVGPPCHRLTGSIAEPEYWSTQFQWLPCDVEFIGSPPGRIKIVSYINNLHPAKHMQLYTVIEKIIASSIRTWNEVVRWPCSSAALLRIRQTGSIKQTPPPPDDLCRSIVDLEFGELANSEEIAQAIKDYLLLPDNPDRPLTEGETAYQPTFSSQSLDKELQGQWWKTRNWEDEIQSKWKKIRSTEHPDAGDGDAFEDWKEARDSRKRPKIEEMFCESGLQVIVKLSSIELTPEKPEYNGGSWHLEGKMNEHIVATSIYYYDVENVTESCIQLRQEAQLDSILDIKYDVDNHSSIEEAYGIGDVYDAPALQDIGSIVTRQGRLLVFPNIVQHRVEPFKLRDPSKPGRRRILVIWLVDPHFRLISSKNVPPQQTEWWKEVIVKEGKSEEIILSSDNTSLMDREEAERLRICLMEERTRVMETVHNHVEFYNFCEH